MTEEERQSRLLLGQQLRTQAEHRSEIEMRQSLSRMYYAVYHVAAVLLGREYSHQKIAVKLSALEGGDYLSSSYKQLQVARSKADYHDDWIGREFGGLNGSGVEWLVRSVWKVKEIGDVQQAYGTNGWPVATTVLPVTLTSGSKEAVVQVLVTTLATSTLRRVMGKEPPLQNLVSAYVESLLRRGGKQAWNPALRGTLEISEASALSIYQLFAKSA